MLKQLRAFYLAIIVNLVWTLPALAGEGVTLVFRSGQVIQLDDGFRQISDAFKNSLNTKNAPQVIELSLAGNSFLMNVSEIVLVCRDRCSTMTIIHQLDPRRGGNRTNVNVDPVIIDKR